MKGTLKAIRERIEQLAETIEAPPQYLPTYESSEHSGRPHVEVTSDGQMHWVVSERGHEFKRRSTLSRDELLYWVFAAVTHEMATMFEVTHRIEGEDFRRQLFACQLGLLDKLSPDWRARHIRELGPLISDAGLED